MVKHLTFWVLRISNNHIIAHNERICKELYVVQVPDMFRISIWEFYLRFMNTTLLLYFNDMKPELPRVCDRHDIRQPIFYLPKLSHEFEEQQIQYQMITFLIMRSVITVKVHRVRLFCFIQAKTLCRYGLSFGML